VCARIMGMTSLRMSNVNLTEKEGDFIRAYRRMYCATLCICLPRTGPYSAVIRGYVAAIAFVE
jgi:hypothetical protein